MLQLKPISPKLLRFYRERQSDIHRISDALSHPKFSRILRAEFEQALKNDEAVSLVEVAVRLGGYGDHKEHGRAAAAVSRSMRRAGYRLPRGKRPSPELVEMVEDVTPLLLYFGVPMATGEGSKLVSLLRGIASEFSVRGDPRDELRRLKRLMTKQENATKIAITAAVARGLEPLRHIASQPPPNISLSDDS